MASTAAPPDEQAQQRRSTRASWLERQPAKPEPAHDPATQYVPAPPKVQAVLAAKKKVRRQLDSPKVMAALERHRKAEAWRAELPPPEDSTLLEAHRGGMLDGECSFVVAPVQRSTLGGGRPAARQ